MVPTLLCSTLCLRYPLMPERFSVNVSRIWEKALRKGLANHQPEPFGETIRQALSALDGLPAKEVLRIHRRDVRGLLVAYF